MMNTLEEQRAKRASSPGESDNALIRSALHQQAQMLALMLDQLTRLSQRVETIAQQLGV